jgi:hypothetical protein
VPRAPLAPPSAEARRNLVIRTVNVEPNEDGTVGRGYTEYFRRDSRGVAADTQYELVSRGDVGTYDSPDRGGGAFEPWGPFGGRPQEERSRPFGGLFGWQQQQPRLDDPRAYQRQQQLQQQQQQQQQMQQQQRPFGGSPNYMNRW